jgi:hypothetical protein
LGRTETESEDEDDQETLHAPERIIDRGRDRRDQLRWVAVIIVVLFVVAVALLLAAAKGLER